MTCWQPDQNLSQLVNDFFTSFSWLDCPWLAHDMSMSCSWLALTQEVQHIHNLLTTCSWLAHDLPMTCSLLISYLWVFLNLFLDCLFLFNTSPCIVQKNFMSCICLFTTWSQFVNISFMTCSCFVHGLLIACSWLVHGLLMAYSFLAKNLEVSKFVHDIPWLGHDLIMTCSWLGHNFFISYWSLVHYLFMTCSWLISWACLMDNSFMNCSQAQFQLFSSVQVQLNTVINFFMCD